jgi:hypothetical protein
MGLWPSVGVPSPLLLSSFSRSSGGAALNGMAAPTPTSTVIGAAISILYPLYLDEAVALVKAFVMNGATVNGNWDVGVYDRGLKLIVSTGSTVQSGANALQEAAIGPITLDPGAYHLGFALSSTTGAYFAWNSAFTLTGGSNYQATFPLPATFVPAGTTSGTVLFGASQRSLVA